MSQIGSQTFGQKLQWFFFFHWEKIVFSVAAVSLLAFIYFGRAKAFNETTPKALDASVKAAERYIADEAAWQKISEFRQGNDEAVAVIQSERTVKPESYLIAKLSGTVQKNPGLRADPEVKSPLDPNAQLVVGSLVVQKGRIATGVDYWQIFEARVSGTKDQPAGGGDEGEDLFAGAGLGGRSQIRSVENKPDGKKKEEKRVLVYPEIQQQEERGVAVTRLGVNSEQHTSKVVSSVCVTGLFPHELQLQEFNRCFLDSVSYNPERDTPKYVELEIQRRKMVDGVEGEWEDITEFVTEKLPGELYATYGPEVVEEAYVDPVLTMKVPPFVFSNIQSFVGHSKVPRIKVDEPTSTKETAPVAPGVVQIDEMRKSTTSTSEPGASDATATDKSKVTAGYKLVRFFDMFDFNVEPQTKVQYRFRVWVADPNMYNQAIVEQLTADSGEDKMAADGEGEGQRPGDLTSQLGGTGGAGKKGQGGGNQGATDTTTSSSMQIDFLQLEQVVRDRLRALENQTFPAGEEWKRFCRPSEWSPETNWVGLPRNSSEIIAGRVNHPNTLVSQEGVAFVEGEPEINVAAKKWDPALQVPVAVAQTVARASVLNFRANGIVFNPINRKLYELDRDLQTDPDAVTGVEFDTHAYVVDLLGGQKMPFSSQEKEYFFPAEILVMDSSGSLRVRNASEDKRAYRHSLFEPDEALSDVEPKKPAPAKEEESDMPGGGRGRGR